MGSFSIWHWLIVLVIIILVFGTKKLTNVGKDLGGAVKGFKEGMKSAEEKAAEDREERAAQSVPPQQVRDGQTIEGEIKEKTKS